MRFVLDTDVVLSGLRSTVGASRILLLAVKAGVVTPLVSVATVIECEAVLKRVANLEAAGLDVDAVDMFVDALVARADHVVPHFSYRLSIRDPDDELFVSVAVNGGADALVTFNVTDDAPADVRQTRLGFMICRPGDILKRLAWRPSATSPFAFRRR
jgi:putative PIN family toxin of toxin-antitoxin system